jgi:hypothetical protein
MNGIQQHQIEHGSSHDQEKKRDLSDVVGVLLEKRLEER